MTSKGTIYALFCLIGLFSIVSSCTEEVIETNEPEIPFNPYDTIDYDPDVVNVQPVDSNTFLGFHTYIFSKRCAVPACHDGSFEPDFRTVQGAYNNLVYHPVVKNTPDSSFSYRVQPSDTVLSWLVERLTTSNQTLGRMPLYDDPLPESQIKMIKDWIMDGAPDFLGNYPSLPDYRPTSFGLLGYLPGVGNMRIDTMRYQGLFFYPFLVPHNVDLKLWFGMYDTNADGDFLLPTGFTVNKVKFSVNSPYDFSNATEVSMTKDIFPTTLPTYFGFNAPYFFHTTINTGMFNSGDVVYVRMYVNDGGHNNSSFPVTEIPDSGAQPYITTFFAFIVQ